MTDGRIDQRLAELGVALPATNPPVGHYAPFTITGNLVFISGQTPKIDGRIVYAGKLQTAAEIDTGRQAARLCAINVLAQLRVACGGDLSRVERCVRIGGFVSCDPRFLEHPQVLDGASELFNLVFGDRGAHARTTIGVAGLPADAMVEVDAIFEIRV
jgi:enamine deaminase RidA (YjgF/YER057c/UK114 family)